MYIFNSKWTFLDRLITKVTILNGRKNTLLHLIANQWYPVKIKMSLLNFLKFFL